MAEEQPPVVESPPPAETPPPPEPQPNQADALRAMVQDELRKLLSESAPASSRAGSGSSIQGIAALEEQAATNPAAQVILDIGAALADVAQKQRALEERVKAGGSIPAERLGAAEAEFASGRYASLQDADAAAYGRAVLAGKAQPPRPGPRPVQTVTRSVPVVPSAETMTEMTSSQWREALKGPDKKKVMERYNRGDLKVVPG